jgi:hypothetical protein
MPGEFGIVWRFDDQAREHSNQVWRGRRLSRDLDFSKTSCAFLDFSGKQDPRIDGAD